MSSQTANTKISSIHKIYIYVFRSLVTHALIPHVPEERDLRERCWTFEEGA